LLATSAQFALDLAHKLSMELRAAEGRINQLEAAVQLFRDRAASAEGGFKQSTKRSRKSSLLRDQHPAPKQKGLAEAAIAGNGVKMNLQRLYFACAPRDRPQGRERGGASA
jgi:hypothetical protein